MFVPNIEPRAVLHEGNGIGLGIEVGLQYIYFGIPLFATYIGHS